MKTIGLQNKTKTQPGIIEKYWFENKDISLENTLFHRINIPLKPFDSGLEYEEQPVQTDISIEWINLQLENPDDLDNVSLESSKNNQVECSIYVGSAHNPCDIKKLTLNKVDSEKYKIEGELFVDFEHEGVAKSESFSFSTTVDYKI